MRSIVAINPSGSSWYCALIHNRYNYPPQHTILRTHGVWAIKIWYRQCNIENTLHHVLRHISISEELDIRKWKDHRIVQLCAFVVGHIPSMTVTCYIIQSHKVSYDSLRFYTHQNPDYPYSQKYNNRHTLWLESRLSGRLFQCIPLLFPNWTGLCDTITTTVDERQHVVKILVSRNHCFLVHFECYRNNHLCFQRLWQAIVVMCRKQIIQSKEIKEIENKDCYDHSLIELQVPP